MRKTRFPQKQCIQLFKEHAAGRLRQPMTSLIRAATAAEGPQRGKEEWEGENERGRGRQR